MSTPYEWRINDIERKAERAESRLYELDALRRDLERLEYSNRETSSALAGVRTELQASEERIRTLQDAVIQLQSELVERFTS